MSTSISSIGEKAYVGVTGYSTLEQARYVHEATNHLLGSRVLMDGYLLRAEDVNSRWTSTDGSANFASRFVSIQDAERIFSAASHGSLRLIHFCTSVERQLGEQLQDCVDRFGDGIDGFQINWASQPGSGELTEFLLYQNKRRSELGLSKMVLVLQLHPGVLNEHPNLDELMTYVGDYVGTGAITHLLYDPSGGQGIGFDSEQALSVLRRLKQEFPKLRRGVAGGLSPENVYDKILPIWSEDASVNIDVESRVRDSCTDSLLLDRVVEYVLRALKLGNELDAQSLSRA